MSGHEPKKMTYDQRIEWENSQYRERLSEELERFSKDAADHGNHRVVERLREDDGFIITLDAWLSSPSPQHISLQADAGGSIVDVNIHDRDAYDRWDWSQIATSNVMELKTALALGYVPPDRIRPGVPIICMPWYALPMQDREFMADAFDIVYRGDSELFTHTSKMHGELCHRHIADASLLPQWAISPIMLNTLKDVMADAMEDVVFMPRGMHIRNLSPEALRAFIEALLMRNGPLRDGLAALLDKTGQGEVDRWRLTALEMCGMAEGARAEVGMACDICDIWRRLCRRESIASRLTESEFDDPAAIADKMERLGRALDVDEYLRGYERGVPPSTLIPLPFGMKTR